MPRSIVQQFGNMLSSRWSLLGQDAPPAPSSKQKVIHEKARYPRIIKLTAENNSCLDPSMSYEHVLACGHVIVTAKSDQPCAPNCYHVADPTILRKYQRLQKKNGQEKGKALEFYCNACVEGDHETLLPDDMSSIEAEKQRALSRDSVAKEYGKQTNYRKCYIALKVTSVPCHSDGTVSGRYTPREEHHPFDTAIPQAGENFFEDMLVNLTEESNPVSESSASASKCTDHTDVNSSPANLGEGGANYLRYTQSIAQRKVKLGPPKPKPVVQNSDTALPVVSPKQSRKRPIVIDEDDEYVYAAEEEASVLKRPAKRHRKSTISTPTAPAEKKKTGSAKRKRS